MRTFLRWSAVAGAIIAGVSFAQILKAQAQPPQALSEMEVHLKYNAGQSVVPIFEGWERVPDGTFNMVFGYFNRNYVQEFALPVGAQNSFEPGPADRGQPTYFSPRENHWLFKVNVPKDWDRKRELVWTIVANGKPEKARASLIDIMEVDRKVEAENGGGGAVNDELLYKNQRPVIKTTASLQAKVGAPLQLAADVTDDGIPVPRPGRGRGDGAGRGEPTLRGAPPSPVNVPLPVAPRPPQGGGLSLLWIVYRGPANAGFEPGGYIPVKDGKVATSATFKQPGTYLLKAIAFDGMLRTQQDVTVTVN